MRTVFAFIALFFFLTGIYAQTTLSGFVKDADSNKPLAYVNIGLIGKNIGTVSNNEGEFKLTIPENNLGDTVRVSMLGYKPALYKASEFIRLFSGTAILLKPSSYLLPDVLVSNRPLKEKVLGNPTESQSSTVSFTSDDLGNEIGILIKIKKSPSYLKSFSASIASTNNIPVKVRLNFYSVKNGMPDQLLHDRNIFVRIPAKNEKLTIDLSSYHIVAEDDFFVSLEWIESSKKQVMFSGSLFGSPLIARETSQGDWEKVSFFGVGFTVKVAY